MKIFIQKLELCSTPLCYQIPIYFYITYIVRTSFGIKLGNDEAVCY